VVPAWFWRELSVIADTVSAELPLSRRSSFIGWCLLDEAAPALFCLGISGSRLLCLGGPEQASIQLFRF